jgi:hypothetical protein
MLRNREKSLTPVGNRTPSCSPLLHLLSYPGSVSLFSTLIHVNYLLRNTVDGGSETLTLVVIINSLFWDITLRRTVKVS